MNRCFWFRQDLRLKDNSAFKIASRQNTGGLIALYIVMHETWLRHCWSDAKVDFIIRQLGIVSGELNKLNIPLKILKLKTSKQIPSALNKFCNQHQITSVYVNRLLLLDEMR